MRQSHQSGSQTRSPPAQVPMPSGDIFVSQPGRHIKHDDGAFPVNVIPISKPAELLLPSCIPAIETDRATVGKEVKRMHLHSNCCCKYGSRSSYRRTRVYAGSTTREHRAPERTFILLLEIARQMTLHECCFSCTVT